MKRLLLALCCLLATLAYAQDKPAAYLPKLAAPLAPLFNGRDLAGFETILQEDGLNRDPRHVFNVENGALHFTGDGYGGIVTRQSYSNYYLRLEFKWGEGTFGARKGMTRDSGVLFHVQSSAAEPLKVWPRSVEFQICEGATGDIWLVDGPSIIVRDKKFTSGAGAPAQYQGIDRIGKEPVANVAGFRPPHELERPHGEWNTLELIVEGGYVRYYVNGALANEGFDLSLTSGRILLQTEGAEVWYRNVELAPLNPEVK